MNQPAAEDARSFSTKGATQSLINSIRNGAELLHVSGICTNLYGFWLTEGIPEEDLQPVVKFLVRMNELEQIGVRAKQDDTLMEMDKEKKFLEKESKLTVYQAIGHLVKLVQPLTETVGLTSN